MLFCLIITSLLSLTVLAQIQNLEATNRLTGAPDLEIVKARAGAAESAESGPTRDFSLVVKNSGQRVITGLGFAFKVLIPADASPSDLELTRQRCGFIVTDLDLQPESEITIDRKLSGSHCIPDGSMKQTVRVEEIWYSDGTIWRHLEDDGFGWKRVKNLQSLSDDPSETRSR
jgi:hypothetical protein